MSALLDLLDTWSRPHPFTVPVRPAAAARPPAAVAPALDRPVETGERFDLEVVTTSGRAARVRLRLRADVVEVWHCRRCTGIFDRARLRRWMAAPGAPLVVDDVMFSLDRMVDREGRVAITVPDVVLWTLSPGALADLRKRL